MSEKPGVIGEDTLWHTFIAEEFKELYPLLFAQLIPAAASPRPEDVAIGDLGGLLVGVMANDTVNAWMVPVFIFGRAGRLVDCMCIRAVPDLALEVGRIMRVADVSVAFAASPDRWSARRVTGSTRLTQDDQEPEGRSPAADEPGGESTDRPEPTPESPDD